MNKHTYEQDRKQAEAHLREKLPTLGDMYSVMKDRLVSTEARAPST